MEYGIQFRYVDDATGQPKYGWFRIGGRYKTMRRLFQALSDFKKQNCKVTITGAGGASAYRYQYRPFHL